MSQISNYAEALFPDRVRIFGRLLQPYCIGHALLLHRIGSPFVVGGKRGLGDLLCAVEICSVPWQRAAKRFGSKITKLRLKAWNWQVQVLSALLDLGDPRGEFEDYLARAWEGPSVWQEMAEGDKGEGAPELILLKVALCSNFGCSHEEALSMPIRRAIYEVQAYLDLHGHVSFVSDADMEAIERAARQ